ncbi:MAG: hypothetical protein ACI92G_001031 [Candidatus Pelagisphaera sp.]
MILLNAIAVSGYFLQASVNSAIYEAFGVTPLEESFEVGCLLEIRWRNLVLGIVSARKRV